MSNKSFLNALNANFSKGTVSLADATATVTVGVAITNAVVNGKFIVTPLAASAAALSFVSPADGVTAVAAPTMPALNAVVLVHCVNAAGARKELIGPYVPCDAVGNISGVLKFPSIPDTLTPVAYSTIRSVTNPFVFGVTLWNAAGVIRNSPTGLAAGDVAASINVSTLPERPLTV
jgi:hypothetical protein